MKMGCRAGPINLRGIFMKKKERGPKYLLSPLNNRTLNYREYYMSAVEKLGFFLLTFGVGGCAGLVFYGGLFRRDGEATTATYISDIVVFLIVGLVSVRFFLPAINEFLKDRRNKKLEKQFADLLEGLSASLASGGTVSDAFRNARVDLQNQYSPNEMIVLELGEIVKGMDNGVTLEQMILDFGKRSGIEDIENFSNVISNCYRLGGNFRDVMRKTRNIISDKMAISDEITTKLASNKLQLRAMCLMPVVLVGLLKISSSTFAENLSSAVGVIVTTIAVALFVAA